MTNNDRMFDLAESIKALRDDKDALEQRLAKVKADIEEMSFQLSELMAESETQNFTRAGTMFYLQTKTLASAVTDAKDELYTALKAQGYGDLVYETVNSNSLSAFVREQMAENGDALPPWLMGLVNVYEKTGVGLRKSAK